MRAEIIQDKQGYTATFSRTLAHTPQSVWQMLTDNQKLKQWFSELSVEDLKEGGTMRFDFEGGSYEELAILEYEEGSILGFEWWKDQVHFEVRSLNGDTQLLLIETIRQITPHTAKELTGWHVCLDVIQARLDGEEIDRDQEWQKELPEYERLLDSLTGSLG
ncbi:SRPBCC domain-containing protein [Planococcus ruber]|uniref:SRPBCC domain-containing protein n=1 Tax=Planococcus ruber TaxID=2027871 RepID=UPI001FEFABD9|nr:SRPBCC domain-containing protein [Planococcus ruber]MCJ1908403.1 SRPBCC domain-containing protein [Planococcus ruber]